MPITLEKLFSQTRTDTVEWLGETAAVEWSPSRWTAEMQEFAEAEQAEVLAGQVEIETILEDATAAEAEAAALDEGDAIAHAALEVTAQLARENARALQAKMSRASMAKIRDILAKLIVTWDVLGEDGQPVPSDVPSLKRMPDIFLTRVWLALFSENQADPQQAPKSDEPSNTERTSAPSPTGTTTSSPRKRSGSPRSSSTNAPRLLATTPSGAAGR